VHVDPLLTQLVVLIGAALPVALLFRALGQPAILGFLLTGLIIGPHGTGIIASADDVSRFAEIGVVLLLFSIGLEFSLARIGRLRRILLLGGALQLMLTAGAVAIVAAALGLSPSASMFAGLLVALSSTAIVLRLLAERRETDTQHGRAILAILLFQDLCVVPLMVAAPLLAGRGATLPGVLAAVVRPLFGAAFVLLTGRYLVPRLLHVVARLGVRELFTLAVVFLCFGTAWLAAAFGLPLAVGAFIAGLVVAESDYSHQATAEILPFRDAFSGIFFVSLGMFLDLGFVADHAASLLAPAAGLVVVKAAAATLAMSLLGLPARICFLVGVALAQVGEFSFILALEGVRLELLTPALFSAFVAAAVLSMFVTPLLTALAPRLAIGWGGADEQPVVAGKADRIVIIGYGLNGQNLARVLRATGLQYTVIEMSAELVRKARTREERIIYGDAQRPVILGRAGVRDARAVVIAISDHDATRRIVALVRQINADGYIIVRTRAVTEVDELRALGADEVVPEEFETSIEIFSRVLRHQHVPRNVVELQRAIIRREGYSLLRGETLPPERLTDLHEILAATLTETVQILEGSPAVGHTLTDLHIRERTGTTVVAAVHDRRPLPNPPPDYRVATGDFLVLIGSHAQLNSAIELLQPPARPAP
jgi:CPA2 family monovalent cation:H+ antiporter-2